MGHRGRMGRAPARVQPSRGVARTPVDLLSLSAHKLYGPKGIGALFVRKRPRARLSPQLHGGGHEQGMRSGTLATHQIVGFGAAAVLAGGARLQRQQVHAEALAGRLRAGLESLPQIVIACINGKVLAGAVELCLACDLRYAASHVTLQMPEAAWGGFPGAGAPVRLPMLVGRARALELMCTARPIDSAEMNTLALVQGVHPKETLRQEVRSPAFAAQAGSVHTLGNREIREAADLSNRLLERPVRAMNSGLFDEGSAISRTLLDLRHTVESLDPSRQGNLGKSSKAFRCVPKRIAFQRNDDLDPGSHERLTSPLIWRSQAQPWCRRRPSGFASIPGDWVFSTDGYTQCDH